MDIEKIRAKLYEDFDAEGIVERQEKQRGEADKNQSTSVPEPVDIYQRNQDRIYEVSQKSYPKGSSAIVNMAVASVIDGAGAEGLARAYKRAKDDIATLREQGERGRAELRRQQYMQEDFLPALEVVINSGSPDALLANPKALDELDKYVLLEGSGKGYSAQYVRQAYGDLLGQAPGKDDSSVKDAIRRINSLLDNGEIRSAVGMANTLKAKIDSGKAMASDISYDVLGRITSFYV